MLFFCYSYFSVQIDSSPASNFITHEKIDEKFLFKEILFHIAQTKFSAQRVKATLSTNFRQNFRTDLTKMVYCVWFCKIMRFHDQLL